MDWINEEETAALTIQADEWTVSNDGEHNINLTLKPRWFRPWAKTFILKSGESALVKLDADGRLLSANTNPSSDA